MRIYIADFETTPFDYNAKENYKLKARFICFINLFTNERLFLNIEQNGKQKLKEFLLSLTSLKNPTRIYFHNLRFDIAFLYELLPTKEFKYHIIRNNSKILQFKIYKEYKRLKKNKKEYRIEKKTFLDIRDSLVLLPTSIKELGKSLGYPKLEQDYFSDKITKEYIDYCYRDIKIVQKSLFRLQKFCRKYYNFELNLRKMPLTLPSLAKRLFHYLIQIAYGKDIIRQIYNIDDKLEQLFRNFYYGGRVETFNFNKLTNGYYNDFNSHYPSIMRENKFPIPKYSLHRCFSHEKCFSQWKANKKIFGCFCIIHENHDIPLIASKINDKLIFGNGKKQCFLFRKELEYLLSLNVKIEIKAVVICEKYLPIFNDFVNITYNIKKNAKFESDKLMSKLLMNSLYGKFAEKKEKERIDILHAVKCLPEKELRQISITEKGFIKRSIQYHDTLKTNIIFSMMITSLARLKLHQYILESDNPYYCDTDSIISKKIIENSTELGKISIEFQFKQFQSLGCKEYVYENQNNIITIKMKGFGALERTHKEFFNNFESFIQKYQEPIRQNRLIGFFESFVRDMPFSVVLVYDKYKQNVYDKRWINKDLTTRPFHLQHDNFDDMIKNNRKMIDMIIERYSTTKQIFKRKLK